MAVYGRYPYLQEIGSSIRIFVHCPACRREVEVLKEVWARRYGRRVTLDQLEPRLHCQQCSGRGLFRVEP